MSLLTSVVGHASQDRPAALFALRPCQQHQAFGSHTCYQHVLPALACSQALQAWAFR